MKLLINVLVVGTLFSVGTTQLALAESYLRSLGTAYQQQYIELKRLPPYASSSQVKAVNDRVFAESRSLWQHENNRLTNRYKELGRNVYRELNKKLKDSGVLQKIAALNGKAGNVVDLKAKPVPSVGSAPSGSAMQQNRKADNSTGAFGGVGTASDVSFGGGAASNPNPAVSVDKDGIIQSR